MSNKNFKVKNGLQVPDLTTAGVVTTDSSGNITSSTTLSISQGGTGQTTAGNAINALLPIQSGKTNYFLQSSGTNPQWAQAWYQTIQDNGTNVTPRSYLNIVGGTITDSSGNDTTTISLAPITPTDSHTGSKLYVGTTAPSSPVDGDIWIDNSGGNGTTFNLWQYSATGGETSLSGSANLNGTSTLSYTPGLAEVYINGAKLVNGSDYTATDGTSITGLSTLYAGDVVEVISYNVFNVTTAIPSTTFTTKGDIIAATGNATYSRFAKGTDGYLLSADSTQTTGLNYIQYPPRGTTSSRPTSPAIGDIYYDTTLGQMINWTVQNTWVAVGTAAPNSININYLVVAGGGGGGSIIGGGGGAGGLLTSTNYSITPGTQYTVTVGAGGTGDAVGTTKGSDSSFSSIIATGGGQGGELGGDGRSGGSAGGGGSGYSGNGTRQGLGGTVSPSGQGNNGGNGNGIVAQNYVTGGGGGGAGTAGSGASNSAGGNGGDGLSSSITGSSVYYAGGGGGGGNYNSNGYTVAGSGGQGGGANGGSGHTDAPSGSQNTGGGGGGAAGTASGYGGSGVVIISAPQAAASTTGSPTVITSGGRTIYKFTASGSITF